MDASDGACEAIDRIWRANTGDAGEHPVEDCNLSSTSNNSGNHLYREEYARWNVHVVAKFEVGRELESLGRSDIAEGHEDHVRNGSAWKDSACYELANQIYGNLLVGNGHNDADRDEEDGADGQCEEHAVPREMDIVAGARQRKSTQGRMS